ncbi:hypothetical protein KUTeg_022500 [Tegillarca granosa]|uniref:Notch C-terminal domain-containing protein n=1 Tax=Tegillarca granosa TaxID=220873 RepID=A0ABQ9E6D3_TEGGR|nr:hypothetical protein KUTeg_022500 [Tegillarca granosa]
MSASVPESDNTVTPSNVNPIIFVVVSIGAVLILIFVILYVLSKKKVVRGITWFPEGFRNPAATQKSPTKMSSNKRRVPDGEEVINVPKGHGSQLDMDGHAISPPWDGDDEDDQRTAKRIKLEKQCEALDQVLTVGFDQDSQDSRQWTQQHLNAANVITSDSMLALTPPEDSDHSDSKDVNVRGPDGYTPLMLASFRGGGLDTGMDDDSSGSGSGESGDLEDRSVDVITSLLVQGAAINAQTDRTGETSLHLAARYARADAAKVLLDASADPNCQDSTGRTPLHTAVAADAQGVFQMLDGTTPMILAVRLAVEGMVEELINADADVNAADEYGKTALHWAAAVNNAEAAHVLLQHGANRDAQDFKDETPLFLAAREGSYETAKILLDHYANRDITDHMDRLPRDVATERMHDDILHLLDEYHVNSPAGMALPNGMPTSPNQLQFMHHPMHPKSRQKKNRTKNTPVTPNGMAPNGVHHPRKTKSKKKTTEEKIKAHIHNNVDPSSIGNVSPGNSIESPLGYERTPPSYDSMYGGNQTYAMSQANPIHHSNSVPVTLSQSGLDEQAIMAGHYDSSPRLAPHMDEILWHQGHSRPQTSSIPTPPNSMQSNNGGSPHAHGGKHSPPKSKNLPTSPTHIQAMQQRAQQKRIHTNQPSPHERQNDTYSFHSNKNVDNIPPNTNIYDHYGHTTTTHQRLPMCLEQYPTPPSQHSYSESPPQMIHPTVLPEHYLTPSPDSPGQWSSSSPHSAHSDWSDAISSPDQPIQAHSNKPVRRYRYKRPIFHYCTDIECKIEK